MAQKRSTAKKKQKLIRMPFLASFYSEGRSETTLTLLALVLSAFVLTASLLYVTYDRLFDDAKVRFSMAGNGSLFGETPMNQPSMTLQEAMQWSVDAIAKTLRFSFNDTFRVEQNLADYFSPSAQAQMIGFLQNSGLLATVVNEKTVMSIDIAHAPLPYSAEPRMDEAAGQEVFQWQYGLCVKTKVNYNPDMTNMKYWALVTLKRISGTDHYKGVVIDDIQFEREYLGAEDNRCSW